MQSYKKKKSPQKFSANTDSIPFEPYVDSSPSLSGADDVHDDTVLKERETEVGAVITVLAYEVYISFFCWISGI